MNELERGRLAAEVLNNPAYAQAREAIDAELVNKWREARDPETREHLHRMIRSMKKLHEVLSGYMQSGEIERRKLDNDRKRSLLATFSRR